MARLLGLALTTLALGQLDAALSQISSQFPFWLDFGLSSGAVVYALPIVTVFMMAVGLLAALGPARQGLRIDPTEALREQ